MNPLNYIHKSPHRNRLEKYLEQYLPQLIGPVLDIGSKNRRYDFLLKERPTAIDLVENKDKDVMVGDITDLQFRDASFKSVISIEVLEYVSDFNKALGEVSRILQKDGVFVFSIPFMYGFHQDRIRYTEIGLSESLRKCFSDFKIYPIGNAYTIILDIIRGQIIRIKFSPLRYFLYIFYLLLLLPLYFFHKNKNNSYVSGYFVIAHK